MSATDCVDVEGRDSEASLLWGAVTNGTRIVVRAKPVRMDFRRTQEGVEVIDFYFHGGIEVKLDPSSGFDIEVLKDDGNTVITMTRTSNGEGSSLFKALTEDLSELMDSCEGLSHSACAAAIAGRIDAWQTFMKKSTRSLSESKEIGLFGELVILMAWLQAGGRPELIMNVWQGPQHGARDFVFRDGHAIEVKTSLSDKPFKAQIESIVQLDTFDFPHLMVATVKLAEDEYGETLFDLRKSISRLLRQKGAIAEFESGLRAYGFMAEHPGRELRGFSLSYVRLFDANTLPRIVQGTIPGVISAKYGIYLLNEVDEPAPNVTELDFDGCMTKMADCMKGE